MNKNEILSTYMQKNSQWPAVFVSHFKCRSKWCRSVCTSFPFREIGCSTQFSLHFLTTDLEAFSENETGRKSGVMDESICGERRVSQLNG